METLKEICGLKVLRYKDASGNYHVELVTDIWVHKINLDFTRG